MKKTILSIMFVCLLVGNSFAYTYTITTYQYLPDLNGTESMLVTDQGGGNGFYAYDNSTVMVESTSALGQGTGGLWQINLVDSSQLNMTGGQIHEITVHNSATAFLSGGIIEQIWSAQSAWKQEGDPPAFVWNPHITIECLDHSYDSNTSILTGHWLDDGSAFSIYLIDVDGYNPAIDNIQFIPEPATLALLGLGGLLIRKKK